MLLHWFCHSGLCNIHRNRFGHAWEFPSPKRFKAVWLFSNSQGSWTWWKMVAAATMIQGNVCLSVQRRIRQRSPYFGHGKDAPYPKLCPDGGNVCFVIGSDDWRQVATEPTQKQPSTSKVVPRAPNCESYPQSIFYSRS